MDNENSKADISKQELGVLSRALNKSVEHSRRSRYAWLMLLAGFLLGACVVTVIIALTNHNEKKDAVTEILMKRSHETLETLQQLRSSVDNLEGDVNSVIEKIKIAETQAPASRNENAKAYTDLDRYTVYLHFNKRKNKKIMAKLATFLKSKGYVVPDIERVKDKKCDIRYFHDEDKEGAVCLRKHINEFIARSPDVKNIDFKVRNLGKIYPKTHKGLLELWINF
jgi:outer membrane murein-binding lipoprotein Lpp